MTVNQTPCCEEQKGDQWAETTEDNAKCKECPESVCGSIYAVLDFWIVRKEDESGDYCSCAECDAVGDQLPPANMVMTAEMLVPQAKAIRLSTGMPGAIIQIAFDAAIFGLARDTSGNAGIQLRATSPTTSCSQSLFAALFRQFWKGA
jgi:hypothetical protein